MLNILNELRTTMQLEGTQLEDMSYLDPARRFFDLPKTRDKVETCMPSAENSPSQIQYTRG